MLARWHTALEARQKFYAAYSRLLSYQKQCILTETANAATYSALLSDVRAAMEEYSSVKYWWQRDLQVYASDIKFLELIMRASKHD